MSMVRVCHPTDFPEFFELRDANEATFKSAMGPLFNEYVGPLKNKFNTSFVVHAGHGIGEWVNGSYTGCLGRLEKNQSDFILSTIDYPLKSAAISQGSIFFDTQIVYIQDYFFQDFKENYMQILASLTVLLDILPYIALFVISCLMTLLLIEKALKRPRHRRPLSQHLMKILLHCCRLGCIGKKGSTPHRLIFMSMSIFSLLIVHFYSSLIKTNLVVLEDPKLWSSYQEVIKDKVTPLFIREFNVHQYFEKGDPSSSERQLWDWAMANFNESDVLRNASVMAFLDIGWVMIHRKGVLILDDVMAKAIRGTTCDQRREGAAHLMASSYKMTPKSTHLADNYNLLITKNPNALKLMKGAAFSEHFTGPAAKGLKFSLQVSLEMGFVEYFLKTVQNFDLIKKIRPQIIFSKESSENVKICKSDTVARPKAQKTEAIGINNMTTLIATFGLLLLYAGFNLLLEI